MKCLDLTHLFAEPMPCYPGDPPARLRTTGSMDGAGECPMFEVTTGMHVGTHMDAPLHMIPGGAQLSDLAPERFFGRGVLIDARGSAEIGASLLSGRELRRGDAVLVHTGFSERFHDPAYYRDFPEVTPAFAFALKEAGVHLLGLDTPSPDRRPYPIHLALLGAGVLIVENLTNLDGLLAAQEFEVIALPVKFQAEAAPVRVIARVRT